MMTLGTSGFNKDNKQTVSFVHDWKSKDLFFSHSFKFFIRFFLEKKQYPHDPVKLFV